MAIELATAYVSLVPETSKLEKGLKESLANVGKSADTAGKDIGSRLAKTASKAMKDGWKPDKDIMDGIPDTKLDRIGARIGQVIGKGVAGGLRARQLGKEFGDGFQDGAKSVGLGKLVSGWKSELSGGGLAAIGKTAGKSLMMGVTGAAAVGAAGLTGLIGTAITKGFDRLVTIDRSKQKLKALGKSTSEVADIVKIVTDSVTGTPFSLDAAFGTAVQAIGAGAQDISRFMQDVVDAAGFAGTDIERMGLIFNQVLAKGKLTGEEMMQLMEAGLPAKSWITDSYNLTSDQFEKMQKDGEITLDMLQKSIEDHAPGMGKALGNTLEGSIEGMKTAVARLGANFLAAIFGGDASTATDTMADSINKITERLNDMDQWVKSNGPGIQNTFKTIGDSIATAFNAGRAAIKSFMDDIKLLATALAKIFGAMAGFDDFLSKIPGFGDNSAEAAKLREWQKSLLEFGNPNPAGQQGGNPNASRERRGLSPVPFVPSGSGRVLNFDQSLTGQKFSWDCGPGAAEIILNGASVIKSEDQLIAEMGTTQSGTPFGGGNISGTLNNALPNANYQELSGGGSSQLFSDISRSVNAGYGAMLNYNAPAGGPVPVGIKGTTATPYSGNIAHYVAVMGVDEKDKSLLVADPKDGRQYWISADNAAALTQNRGYVAANPGGFVGGGGKFDNGGWLKNGTQLVTNDTGKPELILNPDQQKKLAEQGIDPQSLLHSGSGAAPGPTQPGTNVPSADVQAATQGGNGLDFVRSMGFIPASASSSGVAGTSSLSGFINMGNSIVSGVIDTGVNLANQAVSAAIMAGAAGGSFGAGAAAAPLADMAASYGIQLAGNQAKRISSYWFQMAGIGADSLMEQLSPFGMPRWLGYDYTNFAPQLNIQQALTSSVEKMGADAINKAIPQPIDPTSGPAAPSTPVPTPSAVPAQQFDAIAANSAQPQQSAPLVENLYATDIDGAFRALDQTQRRNMMQYAGRP